MLARLQLVEQARQVRCLRRHEKRPGVEALQAILNTNSLDGTVSGLVE